MAIVQKDSFTTCSNTVTVFIDTVTLEISYDPPWILELCNPADRGFAFLSVFCQEGTSNEVALATIPSPPWITISSITPGHANCPVANCDPEFILSRSYDETVAGANDGRIDIFPSNILGEPLTHSIDGGATYHSNNLFSGLSPGTYDIKVKYGNICVKDGVTHIINAAVCDLVVNAVVPTNVTTFGGSDGQLAFNIAGGTGPFLYSKDNGVTTQGTTPITGLTAGTYIWQVEDDNGCTISGSVDITEPADTISGIFDPTLIISDLIPYEFQLNLADSSVSKELYNDDPINGLNNVCFFHSIGCSDAITLQFEYEDVQFGSTPRIRVRDRADDSLLDTITTFDNITDNLYSIAYDASAFCGQVIYLEIISYDGAEQFVHATSGPISIAEPYFSSVKIIYSDSQDYLDIGYKDTGYFNILVIPANFYEQDNPQTDAIHQLSDGSQVKLRSTLKRSKKLNIFKVPDYIHEKIQGAIGHDNVTIDGIKWVKDSEYEKADFVFKQRMRNGTVTLLNKESFYHENIL
jgi:hypothetical protein